MRACRRRSLLVVVCCVAFSEGQALATPQGSVGLTLGAAGVGLDHGYWDKTVFHLGLRGDVLFCRTKNSDFGIGPYAELATFGFDDLQFGGGISGLIPILDPLPLVLSIGGYGRAARGFGVEPGIAGSIFWGSRSFNYNSNYVMSGGLLTELRVGLGSSKETAILIGAQVDLEVISLPFLFLYNALSGGSKETAPVR